MKAKSSDHTSSFEFVMGRSTETQTDPWGQVRNDLQLFRVYSRRAAIHPALLPAGGLTSNVALGRLPPPRLGEVSADAARRRYVHFTRPAGS